MVVFNLPDMESDEFAAWQALLEQKTGMWLPESRKVFLVAALSRHMKTQGISRFADLFDALQSGGISILDWASLVHSLTVHETSFYRDLASIRVVANYCRNRVLSGLEQNPDKPQHLQVWSVGCSTGEEVYTLAIEMDKLSQGIWEANGKKVYFGVTGIDISYPSLAVAREGIYASRQLDFAPQPIKNFYFKPLEDNYFQVKDELKQRTCFIQGNALDFDSKIEEKYDVVFCQNLLIYFKPERQRVLVEYMAKKLKRGGILVLGHGEAFGIQSPLLKRIDNKHCLAYLRSDGEIIE